MKEKKSSTYGEELYEFFMNCYRQKYPRETLWATVKAIEEERLDAKVYNPARR